MAKLAQCLKLGAEKLALYLQSLDFQALGTGIFFKRAEELYYYSL